ncbi:MAG: HAD-IIB family hydrolase [Anaerorhabdus sp.]
MKIIGSDYDGTLLIKDKVDEKCVEAIKLWQNKGNKFGIVTGRSSTSTKKEMISNNLNPDFIICNNGGVILDAKFNVLKLTLINPDVISSIIDLIKTKECSELSLNDGEYRDSIRLDDKRIIRNLMAPIKSVDQMIADKKVAQIVCGFKKQEDANNCAEVINSKFSEYVEAFENIGCVDIVPKGCDKAKGLSEVAELFNYPLEDVYAIGDSFNDIPMLKQFKSAALEHSVKEVQRHASTLVEDIYEFIEILKQ